MLKNVLTFTIFTLAPAVFLTACGSLSIGDVSLGGDPNNKTNIDRVVSPSVPVTISDRVTSRRVVTVEDRTTITSTHQETEDTFAVKSDNNNSIIMTLNGVDYTLTRSGNNGGWASSEGFSLDSEAQAKDIPIIIGGRNDKVRESVGASSPKGSFVWYNTNPNRLNTSTTDFNADYRVGFATIGIETPVGVMEAQTATATYASHVDIRVIPRRAPTISNAIYRMTMTVDFDANTILGEADSTEDIEGWGTVTFDQTSIDGNGFEGNFTLDETARRYHGVTDITAAIYAGNFFGPNAEDIAGVLQLNGTNANGAVLGIGGFRGDRQ